MYGTLLIILLCLIRLLWSSGEQKKVQMARIFYQNKLLLIRDEPTIAIDTKSEEMILQHLKYCAKQNGWIILTSAHHKFFHEQSDKILFLSKNGYSGFEKYEILMLSNREYQEIRSQEI